MRVGTEVTKELLKNPHIRSVSQQAGRAEQGEDTWGPHYSEFHVDLQPLEGEEAELVTGEIRQALGKFPGLTFKVMPFLAERIEETISGVTAQFVVNIFGDDLDELDRKAEEIRKVLSQVNGAVDVQVESQPGLQETVARLRPERLLQLGFRPMDVLEAVQTAYQGTVAAQTIEGNRVFDVVVILHRSSRQKQRGIGWINPAECSRIACSPSRTGGSVSEQQPLLGGARRRAAAPAGDLQHCAWGHGGIRDGK